MQPSNRYSAPETETAHAIENEADGRLDFARRKRRQLHRILVVMAILGFSAGFFPEDSTPDRIATIVTGLAFTILTLGWCDIDGEERNLARWRFFVPMMVFIPGPMLMIPIYLFVTRGIDGFAANAKAFAFFILMMVVGVVTAMMGLLVAGESY